MQELKLNLVYRKQILFWKEAVTFERAQTLCLHGVQEIAWQGGWTLYLRVLCEYDGVLEIGTDTEPGKVCNTFVILFLRKKSRSLVHRCLVYQVCVTGDTRPGKGLIKLTRITTTKRFS